MNSESGRDQEYLIEHPSGRRVCCSVFGARNFERSVFYSHGFPASRLEASIAHRVAREKGLTIIALDRPGYGGSDWYAGRTLEDWAGDVSLIADYFGIKTFSLMGVSGGTPAAVVAAALLPERVQRLVVVSGVGALGAPGALQGMNKINALIIFLGLRVRAIGCGVIAALAMLWRIAPVTAKLWFATVLPKADLAIVKRDDVGLMLARNLREALRQGVRGVATDFEMLLSDWSRYALQVRVPTTIWHGDQDTYVPLGLAKHLHQLIAESIFHQIEGGGHFMIVDRLEAILDCAA